MKFAAGTLLATLIVASPAWGGGLRQPDASVTLGAQTDIARLVDLASHRLKVRIEYDAAVLRGAVTLRGAGDSGIPDSELWDAVNSALASRGFTIIRASGQGAADAQRAFTVVRLTDAANLVMPEGPFDGNELVWHGFEPGYLPVQDRFGGLADHSRGGPMGVRSTRVVNGEGRKPRFQGRQRGTNTPAPSISVAG